MSVYTVCLAESMTGGRAASKLVEVPGASNYFLGSIVAYSVLSKIELLGVTKKTIQDFGVVSPEVALEMAIGAKQHFKADISLSVTGFAGPQGENVGLVYVAIIFKDYQDCKKLEIKGKSRGDIIEEVSNWMISHIDFLRKAP
jgi:nicotinamide-nucleotide amidase